MLTATDPSCLGSNRSSEHEPRLAGAPWRTRHEHDCHSVCIKHKDAFLMQGEQAERDPLFHIKKGAHAVSGASPVGHTASVTGVDWYSVDNGLFVSGSRDASLKLWDPNTTQCIATCAVAAAVGAVASGPALGLASQVAAACVDGSVRLYDIITGAPTQTLSGVFSLNQRSSVDI